MNAYPVVNEKMSAVNDLISLLLQVLELLLDFAYSSRVIINEENAESLLEAGDMLQFHDIRDAAAEFLEKNLHSSNCLGMMLLSDAHQCKRLYELSWRMCLLHYETVKITSILFSFRFQQCITALLLTSCSCDIVEWGSCYFTDISVFLLQYPKSKQQSYGPVSEWWTPTKL